ncbi:creatininase family protein [Microbacterium sp. NPDC007973]|uniref:creatininase family protein n=1 Tax=Microbacterium sp. NPDC007973 TaxID=3364182 RepID=UPI0036E74F7F
MLELAGASSADVREHVAAGGRLAVLAVGALEAHGPHLPLSTDTIVAERIARAVAERCDGALLPAIAYGETWATSGYPGTISLSPETVRALALDIVRGAAASGLDRVVIVNGDFGNRLPLAAAARDLAAEGLRVLVLDHPGLADAADAVRESAPAAPGMNHAEEIETSMVLASAPELVRMERAEPEYPVFPVDFGLRPVRLHEIGASAVFGDPRPATAEKGERLFAAVIDAAVAQVERFVAG